MHRMYYVYLRVLSFRRKQSKERQGVVSSLRFSSGGVDANLHAKMIVTFCLFFSNHVNNKDWLFL